MSVLCDDISAALTELTLDYISVTFCLKISCLDTSLCHEVQSAPKKSRDIPSISDTWIVPHGKNKKSSNEVILSLCVFTGMILHTHIHTHTYRFIF